MTTPKPRKLPSGSYFINLRLGGENIPITRPTAKDCTRDAAFLKAEYLAGRRAVHRSSKTLREEIDAYIEERRNVLSPVTVRGYGIIRDNRFQAVMDRVPGKIKANEWQSIVNAEAALCAPKTLRNAWGLLRSVIKAATGSYPPDVTLPTPVPSSACFLSPDQITVFVAGVAHTKYAVPALLALSSLRVSEIAALRWEDIPRRPELIRVSGAVVPNEENKLVRKGSNKNATSTRSVPIMIPELAEALERDRQPRGPVMTISQNSLRYGIAKVCREHNLPELGIHDLRHSFASLAYHLQVPERIAAEIGGWKDLGTMHRIYTHIAQQDVAHYRTALKEFFNNVNENVNAR